MILFGDCCPPHLAAIAVCRDLGIRAHAFDKGYIRPDWMTFEAGGVNGHSSLPRDPDWYRAETATFPPLPEHRGMPSSFRRRALEAIAYNAADVLTRWRYSLGRTTGPGTAGGSSTAAPQGGRCPAPYPGRPAGAGRRALHAFPLQLDLDAQIRLHSAFAGVADALRMVIRSFADHAAAGLQLVVKEHPLDNGVRDWRGETAALAALHWVADRSTISKEATSCPSRVGHGDCDD